LIGLYFLTGQLHQINIGDVMILFSAIFTAVHLVMVSRYAKEHLDSVVLCFQQFAVVFVLSFLLALMTGKSIVVPTTQTFPLLFLGLFATLFAFFSQMVSLRYVSEITAALILALQPVFAAVFAVVFGGESITFIQVLGGSLLFAATIINQVFLIMFQKHSHKSL
jgi:drug/metabolite transporter (DMT)-like permease